MSLAAVGGSVLASIPSPEQGVWYLGPFPLRAYALSIITGVFLSVWLGERRWIARGGNPGQISDLALWAVPFGIIGGRIYHVITDNQNYFGEGQNPITALYIWQGGLGIWGAVAFGAVGAYISARRQKMRFGAMADAIAPGIVVAQAVGRFGNYFNQELFGKPLDAWWALEIDPTYRPLGYEQFATFHPTFLYEAMWNVGVAALIIYLDRRFRLGHGQVFLLYVATYCLGRGWIEMLRIDPVEASDVFGLRLNVWTSVIVFTLSSLAFVWSRRRHPVRETEVLYGADAPDGAQDEPSSASVEP